MAVFHMKHVKQTLNLKLLANWYLVRAISTKVLPGKYLHLTMLGDLKLILIYFLYYRK